MTDLERLSQRIDQLEGVVRALYPAVQQLRADVGALLAERTAGPRGAAPAARAAPDASGPGPSSSLGGEPATVPRVTGRLAAPSPLPALDVEALVGRYGALGLATISILLAVGAFVRWAITRGFLVPTVRVVLGLAAAGLLAWFGLSLRRRGSRRFGHILLALSLAIVHVDAWGAGPVLHVVSAPIALGAAALASAALAWLALLDGEPAIFSVGVGGALLAPFVTSTGEAHLVALLVFGFAVVAISVWVVRDRDWEVPVAILSLASVLYANVGAAISQPDWSAPSAFLPAAFALACAGTALFVLPPRYRSTLAQGSLVALATALARLVSHGSLVAGVIAAAALGSVAAYASVPGLGQAVLRTAIGAGGLPLALLGDAVWAAPSISSDRASVVAAWGGGAAIAAAVYARLPASGRAGGDSALATGRAMAIALAGLLGCAAIAIALGDHHPVAATVGLAAFSAVLASIAAQRRWPSAVIPVGTGLTMAALWSWALLVARANYAYVPFLTRPSVAAAAAVVGWGIAVAMVSRAPWLAEALAPGPGGGEAAPIARMLRLIPGALLFLWVRQELSGIISSEVSTFLLIAYYATAGVAAVFAGRVRANPPLRHAGLAVAVYAALKAVAEASQLGIGLRIASYLSAGLFLLAVAYWYRGGDSDRTHRSE